MKKGFGAGMYSEKKKYIDSNSLRQIPYVGEQIERKFIKRNINNIDDLKRYFKKHSREYNKQLIVYATKKSNNTRNSRAYNSIIVYMYDLGIDTNRLPICDIISL